MKINDYSLDELKLKIYNIQKSFREFLENEGIDTDYMDVDKTPIGDNISQFSKQYILDNMVFIIESDKKIIWKVDDTYDERWPEVYSGEFNIDELDNYDALQYARNMIEKLIIDLEYSIRRHGEDIEYEKGGLKEFKIIQEKLWKI